MPGYRNPRLATDLLFSDLAMEKLLYVPTINGDIAPGISPEATEQAAIDQIRQMTAMRINALLGGIASAWLPQNGRFDSELDYLRSAKFGAERFLLTNDKNGNPTLIGPTHLVANQTVIPATP